MNTATKRRLGTALALLACAVGLASLAGNAAAGSGAPAAVNAVEGQRFSGAVASYTSSVTGNQRFDAQAYVDVLGRAHQPAELAALDQFLGTAERARRPPRRCSAARSTGPIGCARHTRRSCTAPPALPRSRLP